jgi:hypothetical protein
MLTAEIITVLAAFASQFTKPTWKNLQTLFMGVVLCRGPRRITNILRVMGLMHERNFSKYHRILSHAKWNGLALSKILLGLLIQILPDSWPILIAVDETLERRKGKNIKAKGVYRDAVRSSQSTVVTCFGLKWECMMLIVPLPWCKRPWALPFLTVLSPSKKANEKAGRRHKTSIDWTMQMVKLVSRWLKRRAWVLIGDGAYACMDLAKTCVKNKVTLISRLRLDAQLFQFPVHEPKKLGRKSIKGKRIDLKALLHDPKQVWEKLTVNWSDNAIQRSTPLLMALYSILTLIALKMNGIKALVIQETTSWYDKQGELTFADIIAITRRKIWSQRYFSKSANNDEFEKFSEQEIEHLIYQLSLAA